MPRNTVPSNRDSVSGQRLRLFGQLVRHGTMEERRRLLRQVLHRIEIDPVTRKGQEF